ncbi:hypothetical protein VTL71DRAFT_1561 [Oculimacula yallundae]|uniref:Uncharacterized protein n=1 Tax=Oculimacula yallundae TaxID=86028 RepID=A0ABR4CBV4_9HELO
MTKNTNLEVSLHSPTSPFSWKNCCGLRQRFLAALMQFGPQPQYPNTFHALYQLTTTTSVIMFTQSLRATRSSIARVARQQATGMVSRRTFITPTAVRQADLVQDLYIKELKAYKIPPVKANDAEGQVQKFKAPAPPKSPEEADIANELKAYESQTVDLEGQAEGGAAAPEVDWFEQEPEEEEAKH